MAERGMALDRPEICLCAAVLTCIFMSRRTNSQRTVTSKTYLEETIMQPHWRWENIFLVRRVAERLFDRVLLEVTISCTESDGLRANNSGNLLKQTIGVLAKYANLAESAILRRPI